ncbi:MAG TPA: TonB-dependent receptor, partial [Rubricoccaceae bacterium]
ADRAVNYGAEFEARVGLGFAAAWLAPSSLIANYTRVFSDVTTPATALTAERTGRPLQGQAPYVVNLGLTLVAPGVGTQLSVLYNRLGSRIVEVSSLLDEDVVENPRDLLDLTLSQPFMGRYEARVAVRDVFEQNQTFSQGADTIRADVRGRSISFGLSARL